MSAILFGRPILVKHSVPTAHHQITFAPLVRNIAYRTPQGRTAMVRLGDAAYETYHSSDKLNIGGLPGAAGYVQLRIPKGTRYVQVRARDRQSAARHAAWPQRREAILRGVSVPGASPAAPAGPVGPAPGFTA